ncbi:hypothetical protein BD560DRAFT_333688 [Blakeslea trispora]|nr:hypothetical protein BD560DRAFT_333688 [Blakeslea trispora]
MPPPSFSPAVNSISQLSRYVKTICLNLDYYQKTKKLREGSLLMFGDNESNLPLLNAKVARSFADRIVIVSRYHQNLDSMDVNQFNRVIQLMENTIVYASEIDVVVYHEKHPKDTDKLFDMLKMINYVFETCSILFQVVTSTDIGKKYISHNTISRCLHFIKNQLNNNLYPLLDQSNSGNNFSGTSSTYLFHQAIQSSPHKDFVSSIISHLVHMFPRLLLYISTEDLDDDMFTTSALISMGPFVNDCCVDLQQSVLLEQTENQENKLSPYEQLKFYALDILKHLFNKYPKHRYWIFEIILNNLGSITTINSTRRYQLRNNQTIHVMSALFMQLIQCSASINHVSSHKNWYRKWNIGYQQALKNDEQDKVKLLDDELLQRASTAWQQNAESAINSVSSFLEFLMSK